MNRGSFSNRFPRDATAEVRRLLWMSVDVYVAKLELISMSRARRLDERRVFVSGE